MKVIFWNVRGCNKPFKQKELKLFLNKHKVDITALLETRVKEIKFSLISKKLGGKWSFLNIYIHATNGRIWICSNTKKVYVRLMATHAQAIQCEVTDLITGKVFQMIVVYAFNTVELRHDLWRFIDSISQATTWPLLIGEDFNTDRE